MTSRLTATGGEIPPAGEMAHRIASFDWSASPLGAKGRWPQSLRTTIDICLNSRFPMFVWWGPRLINFYNDAYIPILGQRHPAALGKPAGDLWAEVWPTIGPQVNAVLTRGQASWHHRVPLTVERNGYAEEAYFTWSHSAIRDESGAIAGVLCVVMEETANVRSEQQCERLAVQHQIALDSAGMGWWTFDPATKTAIYDKRFKEIFGVTTEHPTGEEMLARIHPEDRDLMLGAVYAAIDPNSDKPYASQYRIVRPDGEIRYIEAHGRATFVGEGKARRAVTLVGTVLDVTERTRADIALRASEERFSAFVNNSPTSSWITDADGRVEFLSNSYTETFLLPTKDVLGKYPHELYPAEFAAKYVASIREVAASNQVVEVEETAPLPDGTLGEFLVYKFPLRDPDGRTLVGGVAIDVTERKRALREREQLLTAEQVARHEAERVSRLKDEFLATLSHEIRTPLNAILGWSQLLARGNKRSEAEITEGLEIIERNARAQTQIIEDLLDMSRIISGKLHLNVQPVNFCKLIDEAVASVGPSADIKGLSLQIECDPAALAFPTVPGDTTRLRQVLLNLLSNAVKFTPAGGRITVRAQRVNGQLIVSVTDTGEGIPTEFVPHVFDRFRQADATTTRRHGGLGLGLSIVKQLVELHGGAVKCHSAGPGQGACFTVSLPVASGMAAAPADAPPPGYRPAGPNPIAHDHQLIGHRVLVVDDEPDARDLAKRLLSDCGAKVLTAGNAAEALNLLRTERPDVLVCDIGMPGEDGYSLLRRLRTLPEQEGGQTPAIALTAYARQEDKHKAHTAGFQHHLAKPVEPNELIATVANLCEQAET